MIKRLIFVNILKRKKNLKLFLGDCKILWKIFDWEKEIRGSMFSVCEGWRMVVSFGCI